MDESLKQPVIETMIYITVFEIFDMQADGCRGLGNKILFLLLEM